MCKLPGDIRQLFLREFFNWVNMCDYICGGKSVRLVLQEVHAYCSEGEENRSKEQNWVLKK